MGGRIPSWRISESSGSFFCVSRVYPSSHLSHTACPPGPECRPLVRIDECIESQQYDRSNNSDGEVVVDVARVTGTVSLVCDAPDAPEVSLVCRCLRVFNRIVVDNGKSKY